MKSYLRFLSRNKVYTAIEIVGLSIALAFILILSAYIIDDISTDWDIKDKDKIIVCHNEGQLWSHKDLESIFRNFPEIESCCRFSDHGLEISIRHMDENISVSPLYASSNFFEFMGYRLVDGDASEVLKQVGCAVISEEYAERLFPDENPVGQSLTYLTHDKNMQPVTKIMTVTGVFRKPRKSNVIITDVIMNIKDWGRYEGQEEGYHANLLRISKDADQDSLCRKIYEASADAGMIFYKYKFAPPVVLTRFDMIDKNMDEDTMSPYHNLPDRKMARTFIAVCIILLLFAILNYISLTIAFSRFRSKELATRRLLGTSKTSMILKSFMESFTLTFIAFCIGLALAWLIQDYASFLLSKDIRIFSNPAEIIWCMILLTVLSVITSVIPAYVSSRNKPIDIIKGEARHNDKSILGKVFIGFQAATSIICISMASALWLQTKKMIDTPLGYNTEDVVYISGLPLDMSSELESLACIERLGFINHVPVDGGGDMSSRLIGSERVIFNVITCDTTAISILGIENIQQFKGELTDFDILITKGSEELLKAQCLSENLSEEHLKTYYSGVVNDIKFGNHITSTEGMIGLQIFNKWNGNYLVKVIDDPHDAVEQIREYLEKIDLSETFGEDFEPDLQVEILKDMVEKSYQKEKTSLALIGIFTLLCMTLTAMAIIALSSHHSQLNRHDTAVRKVFGVSRKDVFWHTVWGFIAPVLVGAAAAIPVAYIYIGRWLEKYPIRISNIPLIYAFAVCLIVVVALAAVTLQAIRLMSTNPAQALKKE